MTDLATGSPLELKRQTSNMRRRIDKMREIFSWIDQDCNGVISKSEMKTFISCIKSASSKVKVDDRLVGKVMSQSDDNADDLVSFEEFQDFFTTLLRFSFDKIDQNANGFIDKLEMKDLVTLMFGGKPNQTKISEVFKQIDTDGNQRIEFEEFLDFVVGMCANEVVVLKEKLAPMMDQASALQEKREQLEVLLEHLKKQQIEVQSKIEEEMIAEGFSRQVRNLVSINMSDKEWKKAKEELAFEHAAAVDVVTTTEKNLAEEKQVAERFLALKDKFALAFKKYDLNQNGTIEYKEFSSLFTDMKRSTTGLTPKHVLAFMNEIDKNDDSRISFDEFWGYMSSPKLLPRNRMEFDNIISAFEDGWNIPMVGLSSKYF